MRVLNVCISANSLTGGGTAERTLQMSYHLVRHNVDCTLLELDLTQSRTTVRYDHGVKIISLPCICKRFYVPKVPWKQLCELVQGVDIIHLISHWTLLNIIVFLLARRFNTPYVMCPAGALPVYGRSKFLKKVYNLIIGVRIVRNAAARIAITEDEIAHFAPYGVAARDVVVIPNGIDRSSCSGAGSNDFRRKHGLPDAEFLLFVGRLNPIKGPDMLLEAFANIKDTIPDYHLIIAGPDDGMLKELRAFTKRYNIDSRIHFTGYIDGADKVQAYRLSRLLIIPSRQEAMSIVVLEAGMCGRPVLITDQCGFPQVTEVNGGKVVSATVGGLQEGLTVLLADLAQLPIMGNNLKTYIVENYTWDTIIQKIIQLYGQILCRECER